MNIKKKTEAVIRAYLKTLTRSGKALAGVYLEEAHNDQEMKLPSCELWAGASREREDIPPHSGEFDVDLEIRLYTQADDENRQVEDDRITAIICLMLDIEGLKAFANFPNPKRPVPQFLIQDCYEINRDSTGDERAFVEVMDFKVVCRNDDGRGSS